MVEYGRGDDLVAVGVAYGRRLLWLEVGGLAQPRVTSFVGPMALGEEVSGGVLVELSEMWTFLTFGVKSAVFSRVSSAGTLAADATSSRTVSDVEISSISSYPALFSSIVIAGGCDELVDVGDVEGDRVVMLGLNGLVGTRMTSFVCTTMLGEGVCGCFSKKMDEISIF